MTGKGIAEAALRNVQCAGSLDQAKIVATNALRELSQCCGDTATDPEARKLLTAAYHALRSYQHHNSSEELATEIADEIGRFLGLGHGRSDPSQA